MKHDFKTCTKGADCPKCLRSQGLKICPHCHEKKLLLVEFSPKKSFCIPCQKAYTKNYNRQYYREHRDKLIDKARRGVRYKGDPLAEKNAQLKHRYGISLLDYEEILEIQGNGCGICSGPPTRKYYHVDHDHTTGRVRGLLCHKCNSALGLLGDTEVLLKRAITYLATTEDRLTLTSLWQPRPSEEVELAAAPFQGPSLG